ncbi:MULTISPECIES: winged helix-turn-helix transcriptional regulator [Cyanophyceae]|uniref:winged helix-turn-helix transcriptional regulator n=1 Tax=Cyanophyceae TaxID=3028117 RepID=UPI00321F6964
MIFNPSPLFKHPLRELEEFGLVQVRVYPEVPPHVEYSLIERGRENQSVMTALNQLESR